MTSSRTEQMPALAVGLVKGRSVTVEFTSGFAIAGEHTFSVAPEETILMDGVPAPSLRFEPTTDHPVFEVKEVVIGIGFHWERTESQRFTGSLSVVLEDGEIRVVNHVPVEEYLKSVISSEMSATASPALLKAHAVISRSWVLSQLRPKKESRQTPVDENSDEIIRWYDREDHMLFDVCADDHCQRYQGITRRTTPTVDEAVDATRGEVLMNDGTLCDARFSKCCGGALELFSSCWEDRDFSYLQAKTDTDSDPLPDLRGNEISRRWIMGRPDAFCNTSDRRILAQVLNDYDCETTGFYRWKTEYRGDELGELIKSKSGIDLGEITALTPLERGSSGRIIRLRIDGTLRSVTVGKELEIRRWLSPSHLYSSAFVVDTIIADGHRRFVLHGAGWGHGVGLCQIGAAVMGEKGYDYRQILLHYYPGAEIKQIY